MTFKIHIRIRKIIQSILHGYGVVLKGKRDIDIVRQQHVNAFNIICSSSESKCGKSGGVGIIFSKDRPIQLSALLSSYFEKVKNPCALHVLYGVSSIEYEDAYARVRSIYSNRDVTFHNESDFREDLIALLESIKEEKVFFLVDDMVFIRSLDMDDFLSVDLMDYIPSLRLGMNLERCYTADAKQKRPEMKRYGAKLVGESRFQWQWEDGIYDWGYPLSVDGNLFKAQEVLVMAKIAVYSAPNSFEKSLQWFMPAFIKRRGVCFERSIVVNIPFNKVQTENDNFSGNVSQEMFLEYWQKGYEIDVDKYYGVDNISAHQELPLYLVKRNDENL